MIAGRHDMSSQQLLKQLLHRGLRGNRADNSADKAKQYPRLFRVIRVIRDKQLPFSFFR
jgi:hypothetical protein